MEQVRDTFLKLVRLGAGILDDVPISEDVQWEEIKNLAEQQNLVGVILDGIEALRKQGVNITLLEKSSMVQWIGKVLRQEKDYVIKQKAAEEMSLLFHDNAILTYVLKGQVVSECYPKPKHRYSVDLDCYLMTDGSFDAWKRGNELIKERGFKVVLDYYKNSTLILPGLVVENHRYFTPFRGNRSLEQLEKLVQRTMREDKGEDRFEGTWLYRPPVMVSALFLIEHSYSHFLHEGLTWRLILDWMLFSRRHQDEIDWQQLNTLIDEFGFRKFYDSFSQLGAFLFGEVSEADLSVTDKLMLEDIWAPLDLHEAHRGIKGKLALAGNTFRARWKYRHFTDMSWLKALWIQAKGVLFEKEPKI